MIPLNLDSCRYRSIALFLVLFGLFVMSCSPRSSFKPNSPEVDRKLEFEWGMGKLAKLIRTYYTETQKFPSKEELLSRFGDPIVFEVPKNRTMGQARIYAKDFSLDILSQSATEINCQITLYGVLDEIKFELNDMKP